MTPSSPFASASIDALKSALDGGTLTIYSVARPLTADVPVDRSEALAVFTFATPAFNAAQDSAESLAFVEEIVDAMSVGTPGFARATTADGRTVADFSAGPGAREIKFSEVSFSKGAPIQVSRFAFMAEDSWPERADYYATRPRSGFAQPSVR